MGGMGVVFSAIDTESTNGLRKVALKFLRQQHPRAIAAFKREFRALADLTHPNLVALHELCTLDGRWFFAMELVSGTDFLGHVRAPIEPREISLADTLPGTAWPTVDVPRLRAALRQLAEGTLALHKAGKVHRDIKPSNVLCTEAGRVVLLDFGLVTTFAEDPSESARLIVGTAPYVAPELAAGDGAPAPASDWYSVGVILYEALTAQPPFRGSLLEILTAKQEGDPPAPCQVIAEVPADLSALCMELLERDPARRPTGDEVLTRLGGRTERWRRPAASETHFVGRARELCAIGEAFADADRAHAVVVAVSGPSGMGKSALVQSFVDGLAGAPDTVALLGRCYERESVPYQGFDTIIDALGHHLKHAPAIEAMRVVPRHMDKLARLFPTLDWLAQLAPAPPGGAPLGSDPQTVRRHAFAALRELLSRMADRTPVVIALDDLQWVDGDSAELLAELIRPPDAPAILWLLCYRPDDTAENPALGLIEAALAPGDPVAPGRGTHEIDVRPLAIGALTLPDATSLATRVLGHDRARARPLAGAIARESGGHPYLTVELARYAGATSRLPDEAPRLDDVLWHRVAGLPEDARRLLTMVVVAGGPVDQAVALHAAAIAGDESRALQLLRIGRLIRARSGKDGDSVEPYHDRIRETVLARLPPDELAAGHRQLAAALEAGANPDPEQLADHLRRAGDDARAGAFASIAADRAARALAFDRAARLYRLTLELAPVDSDAVPRALRRLADALANAGRGAEAAQAYLAAAQEECPAEAFELERRAAEQLLRSGHIDGGLAAFQHVLAQVGVGVAATPRRALAATLLRRAFLRVRGLGYCERAAPEVPAAELAHIDALYAMTCGLALVDPIRALHFQTHHLSRALAAGEPMRVTRALVGEIGAAAARGRRGARRAARLAKKADALARRQNDPFAIALVTGATAMAAYHQGRLRAAKDGTERALQMFRERCTGASWEIATAEIHLAWALFFLGEWCDLLHRMPGWLREARDHDDLYAETGLRLVGAYRFLAADDADAAGREVADALRAWSQQGFQVQHYWALYVSSHIDLYRGDGDRAHKRVRRTWRALERSFLLKVEQVRAHMLSLRGAAAVAAARTARGEERDRHLVDADRSARKLGSESMVGARALSMLVRSGAAAIRGEPDAETLLVRAIDELAAADLDLHAAAARYGLGGRARAAAERELRGRCIGNPARLAAMLAPGFD
jgi:hypothetical protein